MQYRKVTCASCDHRFEIAAHILSYGCNECGHIHSEADQENSNSIATPDATFGSTTNEHTGQSGLVDAEKIGEAEQYWLKAEFILHSLQANLQVYGNNSAWSGAQPADVDLALKYINRSLEIWPENPKYLNLKALFLMEGKHDHAAGIALLERAAQLSPTDITIQDNLEKSKNKSEQCFIATAAYGSRSQWQINEFRNWRDTTLQDSVLGRKFIRVYYQCSPQAANWISRREWVKILVRSILTPFASTLRRRRCK